MELGVWLGTGMLVEMAGAAVAIDAAETVTDLGDTVVEPSPQGPGAGEMEEGCEEPE